MTAIIIMKLCCITIISFVMSILLIVFQNKLPFQDIPNERSSHVKVTPRSGGIAMFMAFLFGVCMIDVQYSLLFLVPLVSIFVIGLWDDIYSLSSKVKLVLIAFLAILLFHMGFSLQHYGTFIGYEIVLSYGISVLFYAFAISGFVSAINLIDGLDGLASIVTLAILFPFAYMGYKYEDIFLFYISLILMFSIFGFLCLNWHPAKIFMGDSGSMFIGFTIAMIVVYTIQKEYITAISTLFLAGVPILDTLIVMLRRIVQHANPFIADKMHMHHMILKYTNSTRRTVVILGLLQVIFSYIGLGFKVRDDMFIFLLYGLCFVLSYILIIGVQQNRS